MKNLLKNKLLWIALLIFMLFSTSCIASDVETTSSEQTNDEVESPVVLSDVYQFDTDVTVDKIIDGNAFVFGTNVTISGEIGGDVFVCAETVTFTETSYVHGNIFACAGTITLAGNVSDVYAISDNFNLEASSIIGRDVRITSNNISISGRIKRDAYISTSDLQFAENAKNLIMGNLNYSAASELDISEDVVNGEIHFSSSTYEASTGEIIKSYITTILSNLLYALVIVLLFIWLTPKFIDKSSVILRKKAVLSFGIGLLASLAFIVVPILLLAFTGGLSVSVSLAAITVFILALTIAKTIFAIACTKLLVNKFKLEKKLQFILGTLLIVLILSLVELIPYVGGLVGFLTCMTGFGIIVYSLIKKNLPEETIANE